MANVTITQLPAAGPIQGDELVPIVQNGQTVRSTTAAVAGSPVQTQTFLTLNQEPSLNNSRALAGGTGIGLIDGGAQSTLQVTLNGASGSLEAASNGVIVKTGTSTVTSRSIAVSGTGLAVANGSGVSGNPTVALDGLISAIAQVGGTGLLAFQNGATAGGVLIAGTANQISVANGNGQGGNPTLSLVDDAIFPGTGGVTIPAGTNAQQPVGANGQIRYNTTTLSYEGYSAGSWRQFSQAGGVTTFSAGSTGLTPSVATTGAITLGGTLNVSSGGTGATTLTGYLVGNGASAITAVATIPNAGLTNSSVTYNGVTVSLGGSGTITAASPNALTIGTGLSGGSYNGSSAVTIAIDSTVATLTGAQTLTNKSISGSTNTLTNIPNSALTNSSVTIGTTSISLGGTSLTLGGLTSVALTQDPLLALEAATKQYVDTLVSSGITYHAPVKYEVPNSTGNLNATYNNGTAGVGATLTNAGTLGAFTPDGVVALVNDRVLIYNQTNQFENGVYTVTTVGNGSTAWVLTRAIDADTYGLKDVNALGNGDAFFVQSGNTGAGETYVCNTSGVITFGTTAITFAQVSASQVYSAGTGLTLTGTQFSLTTPVATSNGGTGLTSFTANGIPYASATNTLTTGSNLTYVEGGNTQLTVTSASASYFTATVGANSSYFGTSGTGTYVGSGTNVPVVFYQNNTEGMRLTSSGLSLTANPTLSGGTANGVAYLNASKVLTTGSALTFDGTTLSNTGSGDRAKFGTGSRNIYVAGDSGGVSLLDGAGQTGNGWYINGASSYVAGYIGSSEQMRLNSTGLGIGETSPGAKLDVFSAANGIIKVRGGSATNQGGGFYVWKADNTGSLAAFGDSARIIGGTPDQAVSIYGNNVPITFYTNSERMRITAAGDVGIGTTSPAGKLAVSGSLGTVYVDTSGIQLAFTRPSTNYISAPNGGFQFNASTYEWTNSSQTQTYATLNSSGNLGIGTSSPAARLDVQAPEGRILLTSTTGTNASYFTAVNTGGSFFIGRDNSAGGLSGTAYAVALISTGAYPMVFGTNSAEKMRLDSSGNLGLGVTPSASNLPTIQSSFGILSGNNQTNIAANAYYNTQWNYTSTAVASLYTQTAGQHRWFTAPSGTAGNAISFTQAMTLDASGNLGLGATSVTALGSGYTTQAVQGTNGAGFRLYAGATEYGRMYADSGGAYLQSVGASTPIVFLRNAGAESARITSGGAFIVGTTAVYETGDIGRFQGTTAFVKDAAKAMSVGRNTTTGTLIEFFYDGAGGKGTISTDGTNTAYNTASDYRLKNITGPITTSGAYIDSLNPVEGTWKADGSTFVGLIAHEVQEASRTNVATGTKDGEEMQGMDYSSAEIIANLIAELQSLRRRVAQLEGTQP